jgi:hypothetical protein
MGSELAKDKVCMIAVNTTGFMDQMNTVNWPLPAIVIACAAKQEDCYSKASGMDASRCH